MKTSTDELSDSDFLDVSAAFTRRVKKRTKQSQVGGCIIEDNLSIKDNTPHPFIRRFHCILLILLIIII